MNAAEKARGDQHLFRFSDKDSREMQMISATGSTRELVRSFQFDFCAGEELSQGSFFRASGAMALMDAVVEGYVATIFAYGQTGSGKTYSMSGIEELLANAQKKAAMDPASSIRHGGELSDGVIPRALKYLFSMLEKAPKEVHFIVRASYCEIYNEQVFDLLNPASGALSVRWNDRSGFYVQKLLVVQCDSVDDIMAVVQEGHKNRRVGTHEMNKDSSRSHSIMTVHVDRQTTDPNDSHVVTKFGKMSFVDLAGSERLKETKSSNAEETSNINRSLLTLGKVISALASKAQANFIPYRDSKLTKLLMYSLGGNSLTLMVACVSPSSAALEDTLSTLNYATRAKNIQNRPTVQVDPMELALSNLRRENHQLKAENEALRMRLRSLGGSGSSLRASPSKLALMALAEREDSRYLHHQAMARNPSLASIPSASRLHPLSSDSSHVTLPPIGLLRSPGKERRPTPSSATQISVDVYKNQLVSLQEENEKLVHHSTAAEHKMRQLKAENQALELKLQQLAESS
ncbi:hypothetical protein PybrP1_010842, partial [[Pythium] brassicae (nom. inval.)]